jgi:SOS-response transcriptional repressor LexA
MKELTDRQAQILGFIKQHIKETGYPPTLREIGGAHGISSTNGVNDHLGALERKGYLSRGDWKARSLRVLSPGDPAPRSEATLRAQAAAFIDARIATVGVSPTIRELGAELALDSIEAQRIVRDLTRDGHVAPTEGIARAAERLPTPTIEPDATPSDMDRHPHSGTNSYNTAESIAIGVRVPHQRVERLDAAVKRLSTQGLDARPWTRSAAINAAIEFWLTAREPAQTAERTECAPAEAWCRADEVGR